MQLPYFYEPAVCAVNSTLILNEETSRHCVQVLRMEEGERLQLTNGRGDLYAAIIINANKKHCTVKTEETIHSRQPERSVCIAISLLKNGNRFEWFLEKAVEMGVQEIVPLLCSRTEKATYKNGAIAEYHCLCHVQSRQVWLPALHPPTTFEEVINNSYPSAQKLIAHCADDDKKMALFSLPAAGSVQILIGPEGDFTETEISLALQSGYQPVSLGNTRLRTETAGVVASALLIYSHK